MPLDLALMAYLNARGRRLMFGLGFLPPRSSPALLAVRCRSLLHLFRRETDRVVDFPAVQLLPKAPVEQHGGAGCASCCCWRCASPRSLLLALAFARPYFAAGGAAAGGAGDHRRGRHAR